MRPRSEQLAPAPGIECCPSLVGERHHGHCGPLGDRHNKSIAALRNSLDEPERFGRASRSRLTAEFSATSKSTNVSDDHSRRRGSSRVTICGALHESSGHLKRLLTEGDWYTPFQQPPPGTPPLATVSGRGGASPAGPRQVRDGVPSDIRREIRWSIFWACRGLAIHLVFALRRTLR
jgi:hypothetical protein